jgi:hypothetical protein
MPKDWRDRNDILSTGRGRDAGLKRDLNLFSHCLSFGEGPKV